MRVIDPRDAQAEEFWRCAICGHAHSVLAAERYDGKCCDECVDSGSVRPAQASSSRAASLPTAPPSVATKVSDDGPDVLAEQWARKHFGVMYEARCDEDHLDAYRAGFAAGLEAGKQGAK